MANKPDIGPAYLIVGADVQKRDDYLSRIRKSVAEYGNLNLNHDRFEGSGLDESRIISACLTLPFLSQKRLVEIHLPSRVPASLSDALLNYLENPNASTVLVVVSDSLAKNTKLYKAFQSLNKKSVLNCEVPKAYELENYMSELAKKRGVSFAPHVARHFVDLIGADTVSLSTELDKIITSHTTSDPISMDEVDALIENLAKVKPWVFVDAFAARNAARCFELIDAVEGTSYIGLLYMCLTRVRELLCAKHIIRAGNASDVKIALELGLTEAQSWRCKNHISWTRQYTEKELVESLQSAIICEKNLKSGVPARTAFIDWLLSVLDKNKVKVNY